MGDDPSTPPRDPEEAVPPGPDAPGPAGPDRLGPARPFEAEDWPWAAEPLPGHGSRSDQIWAMSSHLSIFVLVIAFPLAVVMVRGHRSPYVCHHAVEALNFHTTVMLAVLLCSVLSAFLVGAFLLPLVLAWAAVLAVRAAAHARRGAWHRYPFTLRLVS